LAQSGVFKMEKDWAAIGSTDAHHGRL